MNISRREFSTAVGAGVMAVSLPAWPKTGSAVTDDMILIDALGGLTLTDEGRDAIKRSGYTMVDTTIGTASTPLFTYEQGVKDCAEWHGNFDTHADSILHVRSTADIHEAKRTGKLGVMLGFQNATQLGRKIDNVQFFYDLGIRMIQLTYNELNALGAGCTERHDVGLSHFGVDVVHKMNELGIIVDVSHSGKKTTLDAIEASEKPILFSHSNCEALCLNARNKDDEEISLLAERGGVLALTTVNFFVSKNERSTAEDFIAHVDHVAELVGIDHVAIGSDSGIDGWRAKFPDKKSFDDFYAAFKYRPGVDIRWPVFIEELDVPERLLIIADMLSDRGYSEADIAKVMGGNLMRVYEEIIG